MVRKAINYRNGRYLWVLQVAIKVQFHIVKNFAPGGHKIEKKIKLTKILGVCGVILSDLVHILGKRYIIWKTSHKTIPKYQVSYFLQNVKFDFEPPENY